MATSTTAAGRTGRALIDATRTFASESRALSWLHTVTTFGLLAAAMAATVVIPWLPLQLACSVVAGLLIVRGFILYHDYMHGAFLRNSNIAAALYNLYGLLLMVPPRVWRQTHNYHHAHTAKLVGSHVGSYHMVSTEMWREMPPTQQRMYKITRSPITIAAGYLTIFAYGMCLTSLLRNPRRHWDSAVSLVLQAGLVTALWIFAGLEILLLAWLLPMLIACASGAYLFYAQHNFPEAEVKSREEWSYTHASLYSSSYMETGRLMGFFTGNIGYHHVHHLNPSIPFYRLPEAMQAIPELQTPGVTSLRPRDIVACFRAKLWDARKQTMVGYPP